jgi:hypothetical protein
MLKKLDTEGLVTMTIDMQTEHNTRITSAEFGTLWATYMAESMLVCVLKYFVAKTQDSKTRPILEYSLKCSEERVQKIINFYKKIGHPIPIGFTDEDVDVNAPALYSDIYFLNYIHSMSRLAMGTYSMYISSTVNSDVLDIYKEIQMEIQQLYDQSLQLLLSKGLFFRSAHIPMPEKVEFIQKQSYLVGWFGERRPLHAMEIMQVYYNIQRNGIGKTLLLGFAQVAESQKVRDFITRGVTMATVNIQDMSKLLAQENVNVSPTWDSEVLNSKVAPFSDKLMMFHVAQLATVSMTIYGSALGTVTRRDLGMLFMQIMKDAILFAEDGTNIMIDHGWLEKPPHSIDNTNMAKR